MAKKKRGAAHGCFDLHATPLNLFVVPRIEFAETVFATQLPHESRTEAAHGFMG